ncbi:hypothetical protein ACMHYO_14380 [Allopusillimonas ginsengisoli]|uniref:hypothetical protein n=1 Tax=Allopusillimonas ginsengisoli TaxID=453575 RepID=UPI0039C4249C
MIEATLDSPLEIKQGDTFHLEILWNDSEGVPVDMTGCEARMQLRRTPGAPIALDMSTQNGRITLGLGSITLDVSAQDMQGVTAPSGVFDLQIEYPDDRVKTILGGKFLLIPGVSYVSDN